MAMQLASIPQILDLLGVPKDDQPAVLSYACQHGVFAGKAALQLQDKTISQEQLQDALMTQALARAEAAANDFAVIMQARQTQDAPEWLQANWGNRGVNPAALNPTLADGAVAAANFAQNITLLANQNPALAANPTIRDGVTASAQLARGIAGKEPLSDAGAKMLMSAAGEGLKEAVRQSGTIPTDLSGNPVAVEYFIHMRS